jgi:hypothetical protein
METNVDALRAGLDTYRKSLERQRGALLGEFKDIQQSFQGLFSVYGGRMAEDLQRNWAQTAQWFEEYLKKTAVLDRFLEERTAELRNL